MCSSQNETYVRQVVTDFVAQSKQFTAWDATLEAKKLGADEGHRHLKGVVHGMWRTDLQNQGYSRQTVHLPKVPIPPWLYYPVGTDPQDYVRALDPGATDGTSDAASDGDVDLPSDSTDDEEEEDDVGTATGSLGAKIIATRSVTRERRLSVPRKVLKFLGVHPVTGVILSKFNGEIILHGMHTHVNGAKSLVAYRINKDGRVRVNPAPLVKAGLSSNSYKFQEGRHFVYITAA